MIFSYAQVQICTKQTLESPINHTYAAQNITHIQHTNDINVYIRALSIDSLTTNEYITDKVDKKIVINII